MANAIETLLNDLIREIAAEQHGNGWILNSEFDEHTGHGSDDPRRLEQWCLTTHIPGTVIPLRILYLCAINDIGGFAHWCYAVDDPDQEHISNYINDLWFARHDLLKDARHAHARRFAKR